MNTKKRLGLGLMIVALVALGVVFFYKPTKIVKPEKETKLKVAYWTETREIDVLVNTAEKQGFFKKYNITVEKVLDRSAVNIIQKKNADIAMTYILSGLNSYLNNQNIKWIGTISNYPSDIYIVSRYPKNELSKVKKIGVNGIGGPTQLSIQLSAKKWGFDNDKIQFIPSNESSARIAMLEKGDLDLTFVQTPEALGKLSKYYVINPDEFFSSIQDPRGIMVTNEIAESKQVAVTAFNEAISEAIDYTNKNEKSTIEEMKKDYKLSDTDAKKQYSDIIAARKDLIFSPKNDSIEKMKEIITKAIKVQDPNRNIAKFADTLFSDFKL